jgi:hypothetical protein
MIGWATRYRRHNPIKAQRRQVQLSDKHVDHPHRVIFAHVIVQVLRTQDPLPAILTFDEALHPPVPTLCPPKDSNPAEVSTQPRATVRARGRHARRLSSADTGHSQGCAATNVLERLMRPPAIVVCDHARLVFRPDQASCVPSDIRISSHRPRRAPSRERQSSWSGLPRMTIVEANFVRSGCGQR